MRRVVTLVALAAFALLAAPAIPAHAADASPVTDVTVGEITSMRSGLDGMRVRFEAEVISEPLGGGAGHVWVNVLADGTGIGVWMPAELADDVEVFGRYSHTGDIVRIVGVLNEGCDLHGGDLDVHAERVEIIQRGSLRENPAHPWKLAVGLAGLVLAGLGWYRMKRREGGGRS